MPASAAGRLTKPAEAKSGSQGVYRQAVASPDGSRVYAIGREFRAWKNDGGMWETSDAPIGLQLIDPQSGLRLSTLESDAHRVTLSEDGASVLLHGWLGSTLLGGPTGAVPGGHPRLSGILAHDRRDARGARRPDHARRRRTRVAAGPREAAASLVCGRRIHAVFRRTNARGGRAIGPPGLPDSAIGLGEGFALATRWRTFSRWQRALTGRGEFPLLVEDAERQAAQRPPHPHRVLLAIVRRIEAVVADQAGRRTPAASEMTPGEIEYCRGAFTEFTRLVFACTGGALRIEATELVLEEPARQLSSIGKGRYWLSAANAFAGRESMVPPDMLDSIAVYYKLPRGIVPALHGGAVGRDRGLRGSAHFSLWVSHWNEPLGPFNRTVIASLHEWLHNVSFYAHRVMGETAVPDCHAGEEYGYGDSDGGYPQWQAWNRDLMLRYTPREFWRRLTSRGRLLPPERLGFLFSLARGWRTHAAGSPAFDRRVFYGWYTVAADWMRRLPALEDGDLRRITGLRDLRVELRQSGPNSHVVWALRTSVPVDSPYADGDSLRVPPALDNVLSLGRLPAPGPVDDPVAAYTGAPLESIAWIRSPRAARDRRDLLLVRVDVAPWLLPRLRVVGRSAADSVVGYLSRKDPSEGHPVNLLVAAVDLGEPPPGDELAACAA